MSNGLWTGGDSSETLEQAKLTRHRLLLVSPGSDISVGWPSDCASGFASLDPNTISPGTVNPITDRGVEGGPHFVMSGETPDESHTYGFEFCILNSVTDAVPGEAGYDVTIWVLISNTMDPSGFNTPEWAALQTQTGVGINELWHSFDVNAEGMRFQFENLESDPTTNNLTIGIAFAEL